MTEQEQRIAIVQACGKLTAQAEVALKHFEGRDGYPDAVLQPARVPDYLHDLNAMAEAELMLSDSQWSHYSNHLHDIACRLKCRSERCGYTIGATAAQRAEAFLRTIGKWKDS